MIFSSDIIYFSLFTSSFLSFSQLSARASVSIWLSLKLLSCFSSFSIFFSFIFRIFFRFSASSEDFLRESGKGLWSLKDLTENFILSLSCLSASIVSAAILRLFCIKSKFFVFRLKGSGVIFLLILRVSCSCDMILSDFILFNILIQT